jgi:hypothetical protein
MQDVTKSLSNWNMLDRSNNDNSFMFENKSLTQTKDAFDMARCVQSRFCYKTMHSYFSEFLAKEEYKCAYLSDEWSKSAMINAIMKRHSVRESNHLTTLRKVHTHTQNTLSTCLLHKIDVVNQLADVDEHMLNGN